MRPPAVVVYSDSQRWWAEGGADAVPVSDDGEPRLFGIAAASLGDIGLGPFVEEKQMPSMARRMKQWEAGWFARGEERGMARGEAKGIVRERERLCEQAELKFGAAVGAELARRLEPVSDTGKLREAGALIIRCADGAEFLARVRPNGEA